MMLRGFGSRAMGGPMFLAMKAARGTGLPAALSGGSRLGFAAAMLAATAPWDGGGAGSPSVPATPRPAPASPGPTVQLFGGCIMNGLFAHVHRATRRTLEANGFRVVALPGQGCCGALHAHAGDRPGAKRLAARNVAAFGRGADLIAVNSAGCGAMLKEYGHLLDTEEARAFGARVKDVSELLAERGPIAGAPLALQVAYDAPCHLQHAQRVQEQPLRMLHAVPGLRVQLLPGSDRCCGSAGVFSLLEPEMSRAVLQQKLVAFADADPRPDLVATGNPGCLMQIGAGLRVAGLPIRVAHPVEVLDWSYRAHGMYRD
jgi:glycolate dehydrogenase iron-sulfur subunit